MCCAECCNLVTCLGLILAWEYCLVSCQMWWKGKNVAIDILIHQILSIAAHTPLAILPNNYWPGVTEVKGCIPLMRCRANHSNPHFCGVQVRGSGHLPTADLSVRRGKMGAEGGSVSQGQLLPDTASNLCVIYKNNQHSLSQYIQLSARSSVIPQWLSTHPQNWFLKLCILRK